MSTFSIARLLALALLVAQPLGAQSYKINDPLVHPARGSVYSFQVGPDGARFLFTADRSAVSDEIGLFCAPLDASALPVELNDVAVAGNGAFLPAFSADGQRVLYLVTTNRTRLYSERSTGGDRRAINGILAGDVRAFQAAAGGRAVYSADQDVAGRIELYSTAVDGSTSARKLSGPMGAGGGVAEVRLTRDGTRAIYRADQEANEVFDLYSVPVDGSAPAVRLNTTRPLADVQDDFRIQFDGQAVVWRADTDTDGVFEL